MTFFTGGSSSSGGSGFTFDSNTNGFIINNNNSGFIQQWMQIPITTSNAVQNVNVIYPMAFPNKVLGTWPMILSTATHSYSKLSEFNSGVTILFKSLDLAGDSAVLTVYAFGH